MSAAVAAALKKIAVVILTNPKALKTICGIVLGVIIIIIMPVVAVISIFSGDVEIDTDRLGELVIENLEEGDRDKLENMDDVLSDLEIKMEEAGYEDRYHEAETLYLLGLIDFGYEDDFADRLVGCFEEDQTDEELVDAANEEFDVSISVESFTNMMESYRSEE